VKLVSVIAELWTPIRLGPAEDLKDGNAVVEKQHRMDAKARYIAFRCREFLRNNGAAADTSNLDIDEDLSAALRGEVMSAAVADFLRIEEAYHAALTNSSSVRLNLDEIKIAIDNNPIYRKPLLRMVNPERNRSHFMWDIVWGLTTNDRRWLDHSSLLLEHVERRLRIVERMRYHVSTPQKGRHIDDNGQDGHTLRRFEYPRKRPQRYDTRVGGKAGPHWAGWPGAEVFRLFGLISSESDSLPPNAQIGANAPATAINALFQTPDGGWEKFGNRTINYCDKVIKILRLDEVAGHLTGTLGEAGANTHLKGLMDEASGNLAARNTRINIDSPWAPPDTPLSSIGSGVDPNSTLGRIGDPFFEYKAAVRLDQLVPGDNLIIRSHPAWFAVSTGAWQMENYLVTRVMGRTLPEGIEVQGHGAGPWGFLDAQCKIVSMSDGFGGGLTKAQNEVEGESLLAKATALNDSAPFAPFVWDKADTEQEGFVGVIEFRNEFRQQGLGAFWARWRIPWDEREFADWLSTVDVMTEWNEHEIDHPTYSPYTLRSRFPNLWELPYVRDVSVDYPSSRVTLSGLNLQADKVIAVYLVSDTRRRYDPSLRDTQTRGFLPPATGGTMLSTLGTWNSGGTAKHLFLFDAGGGAVFAGDAIVLTLPTAFSPTSTYWRPVLVTPIRAHFRAQRAFRWPQDSQAALVGHGQFNIGYFPLFEPRTDGSHRRMRTSASEALGMKLLRFYESGRPDDVVAAIRPRSPAF